MHVCAARPALECTSKTCRDHAHAILHRCLGVPRIFLTASHPAPLLASTMAKVSSVGTRENSQLAQCLRNVHQLMAFEQAELIWSAALDPAVAGKARKGDFVRCLDHFKLLQSPINGAKVATNLHNPLPSFPYFCWVFAGISPAAPAPVAAGRGSFLGAAWRRRPGRIVKSEINAEHKNTSWYAATVASS